MPSGLLSNQKQKFSEPSNQITWNFVILEAVVLIILFFKQLFKTEFKAWPLSLNPRTSNQSKKVSLNFPAVYCVIRYKASRSFVKTDSVQKKKNENRFSAKENFDKNISYEYLQTLCKYFQDYPESFRGNTSDFIWSLMKSSLSRWGKKMLIWHVVRTGGWGSFLQVVNLNKVRK